MLTCRMSTDKSVGEQMQMTCRSYKHVKSFHSLSERGRTCGQRDSQRSPKSARLGCLDLLQSIMLTGSVTYQLGSPSINLRLLSTPSRPYHGVI